MRVSRSAQLHSQFGFVHKYWQCHNKQFLLKSNEVKEQYMQCTDYALKHSSVGGHVNIFAYCLMDNHSHMNMSYSRDSNTLSSFMRVSHARFGTLFNKIHNRSGKVANERPHTPLIENPEHLMRVQFYIDANPIRANMVKPEKLKFYKYSSFKFYAYGVKDKWSRLLTIPDWYLDLGKTMKQRQSKYRILFLKYLKDEIFSNTRWVYSRFIGSPFWQERMKDKVKDLLQNKTTPTHSENSS